MSLEGNLWMHLQDSKTIMSVYDHSIPDDQRIDYHAVCQDVSFQLIEFLFGKRRDLVSELLINHQVHLYVLLLVGGFRVPPM